jgi:hydroxymethylglutaryl-CoA synthase
MEASGTTAQDYTHVIFHQPNTKFPMRVGKMLGFTPEQVKTGLLAPVIGNTYAGASLVGLTNVLDNAKPDDRLLLVSFGSGAGSDAFDLRITGQIEEKRNRAPLTENYISRRTQIDYATYAKHRGKITMK